MPYPRALIDPILALAGFRRPVGKRVRKQVKGTREVLAGAVHCRESLQSSMHQRFCRPMCLGNTNKQTEVTKSNANSQLPSSTPLANSEPISKNNFCEDRTRHGVGIRSRIPTGSEKLNTIYKTI
eukprot:Lithocolla_globosa_v1_NODE_4438_length_1434_cov_3.484409.p3 type:complete len:125 gc:universal NODE_4438_length_1434_cov_3.484409:933-1307(+)